MADKSPNGKQENGKMCESLLPHAQAVLQNDMGSEANAIQCSDLLYNVSWFDWQQGRYDSPYKKDLEVYNGKVKILGEEDQTRWPA